MIELSIQKSDLDNQLWPMTYNNTVVFGSDLLGEPGLFGIKNNKLNFIPLADIPEVMVIHMPENTEEVQGFLISAEYFLQRTMMTPNITVHGFRAAGLTPELEREAVMGVFADFVEEYNKNANMLDRIKNKW